MRLYLPAVNTSHSLSWPVLEIGRVAINADACMERVRSLRIWMSGDMLEATLGPTVAVVVNESVRRVGSVLTLCLVVAAVQYKHTV